MSNGGRLVRASALVGLPVVSVAGGKDVAEIRDVVYSAEQGRVLGFTLNKRGFFSGRLRSVLPANVVVGFGHDAVMVPDADSCVVDPAEAATTLGEADSSRNVLNNPVLGTDGIHLGRVLDIIVGRGPGVPVIGYEIADEAGDGRSPSRYLALGEDQAASGDALVVPSGSEARLLDDLAALAAAMGWTGAGARPQPAAPGAHGGSEAGGPGADARPEAAAGPKPDPEPARAAGADTAAGRASGTTAVAVTGRRVVLATTAEEIGTLLHIVVDAPARHVVALGVRERRNRLLVRWADLTLGPDAVMVTGPGGARVPVDDRDTADTAGDRDPVGKRVLTDDGDAVGTVTDVAFDPATGRLETLVLDGERVDAGLLLGVGPYAVVIGTPRAGRGGAQG